MSTTDPLGVAVIGTGTMGAVADTDGARAKSVAAALDGCAAYTDPLQAMDDPGVDAVLVASPGPAHEAALLAALERDLPVLCEKPMTPDAAAALRVVEAETRLGRRRIQVGFMRRHDSEYQQLKHLLDEETLGRPLLLHCRHRNASIHPYFTDEMLISDSVAHEFDAARWLLGHEVAAVTVLRPAASPDAPDGLHDPQFVVFETDGGVIVDVEIFVSCGFGYQVQAEAVCSRGTARIGDAHGLLVNTAGRWGGAIAPDYLSRFADAYDREVQAWVDATRRGEVTGASAWDGLAVAAACEAGVTAQRTGRRTEVRLPERPALYG
jgi:myo-inositol 2-dehydrogenase/D-chiro-inositol 1-dehydrogenase